MIYTRHSEDRWTSPVYFEDNAEVEIQEGGYLAISVDGQVTILPPEEAQELYAGLIGAVGALRRAGYDIWEEEV